MSISIPRIPSSWPKWDWEASNGSATAAQTQASLAALLPMQRTDHFRHEVWNDLVDALNDVLTEAGLTWDSTYTTAAGAKISSRGKLTAAKFNSVVYNILIPFSQPWMRWEYDEQAPEYSPFDEAGPRGFLGRTEVKGKTETGDIYTADNVYGWYIYEVARRLNVLIDMLADDANWAELAESETAKVLKDIFLSGDEARAMKVINDMVSSCDLPLMAIPTVGLTHYVFEDYLHFAEELLDLIVYRSIALFRQGRMKLKVSDDLEMPKGVDAVLETRYAEMYFELYLIATLTAPPSSVMTVRDRLAVETSVDPKLCADEAAALATDEQMHSFVLHLLEDTLLLARAKPLVLLWEVIKILTGGLRELTDDAAVTMGLVKRLAVALSGDREATATPALKLEVELDSPLDDTLAALLELVRAATLISEDADSLHSTLDAITETRQTTAVFSDQLVRMLLSADSILEVKVNKGIWYDPIQTDTNIYVRSVADPVQTGSNVYIGRE